MGDSAWMRLLPGQRCRTPISSWIPYDQDENEDALDATALKNALRPLASLSQSSVDFGNDILFKEADRLQSSPSVDEMADMLRTTIMLSSTPPTLSPRHTSYVLHLVEGYGKARLNLSAKEKEVAQLEAAWQEDKDRSKALADDWSAQEARYKAEIKRLELIIQQISGKGVEAVALARSGSLVRRNGIVREHKAEAEASEGVAVVETCHEEYVASSPCSPGADRQGRRTSTSSDNLDLAARLDTKRQLWRHHSEDNLKESAGRTMAEQIEHRQSRLLLHSAAPPSHLAMDAPELEPEEGYDSQ